MRSWEAEDEAERRYWSEGWNLRPSPTELYFAARQAIDRGMRRREEALRWMLCQWVSELPPTQILRRDRDGVERLVGLGYADEIVIRAPEGTP